MNGINVTPGARGC